MVVKMVLSSVDVKDEEEAESEQDDESEWEEDDSMRG